MTSLNPIQKFLDLLTPGFEPRFYAELISSVLQLDKEVEHFALLVANYLLLNSVPSLELGNSCESIFFIVVICTHKPRRYQFFSWSWVLCGVSELLGWKWNSWSYPNFCTCDCHWTQSISCLCCVLHLGSKGFGRPKLSALEPDKKWTFLHCRLQVYPDLSELSSELFLGTLTLTEPNLPHSGVHLVFWGLREG